MQSDDDVPARARFQGSFGSLTNYLGQLTPQRLRKSIGRNRERRSGEHVGSERRRRWWESAVGLPMPLGFITVFPYLHYRFFFPSFFSLLLFSCLSSLLFSLYLHFILFSFRCLISVFFFSVLSCLFVFSLVLIFCFPFRFFFLCYRFLSLLFPRPFLRLNCPFF